jgi:hypothetical protein
LQTGSENEVAKVTMGHIEVPGNILAPAEYIDLVQSAGAIFGDRKRRHRNVQSAVGFTAFFPPRQTASLFVQYDVLFEEITGNCKPFFLCGLYTCSRKLLLCDR